MQSPWLPYRIGDEGHLEGCLRINGSTSNDENVSGKALARKKSPENVPQKTNSFLKDSGKLCSVKKITIILSFQ
jgi:hypothetical protein